VRLQGSLFCNPDEVDGSLVAAGQEQCQRQ
jgi:hypothetical protein